MDGDKRIAELLVQTKAYQDLEKPTILTSGELGIYYINAEKLCMDGGAYRKLENDAIASVQHACKMTREHPEFEEAIDIMVEKVLQIVEQNPGQTDGRVLAISGGQTRDWIFSGPIAESLGAPHIAIYKDGRAEIFDADGKDTQFEFKGLYAVHAVDLLTVGSSVYSKKDGAEKGWVPELRKRDVAVDTLISAVTRNQGAEKMLGDQGVKVHAFVSIDEKFLLEHSTDPKRAISYFLNPGIWSEAYLRKNGALEFAPFFDPNGGKADRAMKFAEKYAAVLAGSRLDALDAKVRADYGVELKKMMI